MRLSKDELSAKRDTLATFTANFPGAFICDVAGRQAYILFTNPHLRVSLGVYLSNLHMSMRGYGPLEEGLGLTQELGWKKK